MFNFFRRRSKFDISLFKTLATYAHSDKYFVRAASYWEMNYYQSTISVLDSHGSRVLTMDPWPEMIFLNATGEWTVKEFIKATAQKYNGIVPPELDTTIINELEKLVFEYKIIELTDVHNALKPEYAKPRRSVKNK